METERPEPVAIERMGDRYQMILTESIYPEVVALKALHAISGTTAGMLDRSNDFLRVTLMTEDQKDCDQFLRHLNDYRLRQILDEQTKAYRQTLLAYVFSQTGLARND